jgi:hypothetical protein
MNDAFEKNRAALARLLGDAALAERLQSLRVGIWSGPESFTRAGCVLANTLGDVLGRLWQRIDVAGDLGDIVFQSAQAAAESAAYQSSILRQWNPPYDFVIAIGIAAPQGAGPNLQIGAGGWKVFAGENAKVNDDPNPVGPAVAAALAASDMFKALFSDALKDRAGPALGNFAWSVWDYGTGEEEPKPREVEFDDVHFFGVGAVTHGLLWVLERWPLEVKGTIRLIDQDSFDRSNPQRYSGLSVAQIGKPKAGSVAERLRDKLPAAHIQPFEMDMNRYYHEHRPRCDVRLVVAGLDSPEARRQLALKLPLRAVNMWTEGYWLGAARFGVGNGWPCLYCAYPEQPSVSLDETGEIAQQTGLKPARVRELLFSGKGIEEQEAREIAQRFGFSDPNALVGKPLRSVRGHLCATGKIGLRANDADSDVPLAFSSLLAGVFGFVELLKELWGFNDVPERWAYNTLHPPRHGFLEPAGASPNCYLCSNDDARAIVGELESLPSRLQPVHG